MKKKLLTLFACVISIHLAYSQPAIRYQVVSPRSADSLDIAHYAKKRGFQAAALTAGVNIGIWGFTRYIQKADFSYINMSTIKENFRHGFVWDNDGIGTNMFLHPYHGSLYYNSARSNGYNYWQSGLFALGGSFMWEMFMENEYPSISDIVATPIGGLALGEVTYRVSDLILDDRKTGWTRFGLEFASFLVSPMRGLNRIINGDAWRRRSTSGKQFGVPDVSVDVSLGVRKLQLKDMVFDKGIGMATELKVEYGDRFDVEETKPYDYFYIKADLNFQASQPVLGQINVMGRLLAKELVNSEKHYVTLGLYQHFDYYDSDTISETSAKIPYKFGIPASFGGGVIYKYKGLKKWDIDAHAHLNAVIMGSTLSDHYQVNDRTYNLASGYSTKLRGNFIYMKDRVSISTTYDVYHLFTWKGYPIDIDWEQVNPKTLNAQGDRSRAVLHAVGLRADIKLKNKLYLSGTFMNYTRDTEYSYFPTVYSNSSEGRLMLTYKF